MTSTVANRAEIMLARIERMKKLVVHQGEAEYEGCLFVDAGEAMTSDLDPRYWLLEPEDDGQWTHGPSGTTSHLGAALWGIACAYDPTPVEGTGG